MKALTEQSVVLLKNQGGLLPLDHTGPLRLGLTGPNADSLYHQLGDYTPPVEPRAGTTLRQGLTAWLAENGSPAELVYRPGCSHFGEDPAAVEEASAALQDCDVILAAVGGTSSRFAGGEFAANGAVERQEAVTMDCGENVDDCRLTLPGQQLALLRRLRETGKPVVVILIGGRPYAMEEIEENARAILCAFYPGLSLIHI